MILPGARSCAPSIFETALSVQTDIDVQKQLSQCVYTSVTELPKNHRLRVQRLALHLSQGTDINTVEQFLTVPELRLKLILQVVTLFYVKCPE